MVHHILQPIFLLLCCGIIQYSDTLCMPFVYGDWHSWGPCSVSCAGGTRQRYKDSCVKGDRKYDRGTCNELCFNGGTYYGSGCHCIPWRIGSCCQECSSSYNIPHCLSRQCGGYPDNVRCTNCENPYFSGGYGKGCIECTSIPNCKIRHCSSAYNTVCDECFDDNIFFKRSHSNTRCERLCTWDRHECWPGTCIDGLTRQCGCAPGFTKFSTLNETSCQLNESNIPTVMSCITVLAKADAKVRLANKSSCKGQDFYGNFQLNTLHFDMHANFKINITSIAKPAFIKESEFGVTDVSLHLLRKEVSGRLHQMAMFLFLEDYSSGFNATQTYFRKESMQLDIFHLKLKNGESFVTSESASL